MLEETISVIFLIELLLYFKFRPMPSMLRGVINCAKLSLSHPFSRITLFDQ